MVSCVYSLVDAWIKTPDRPAMGVLHLFASGMFEIGVHGPLYCHHIKIMGGFWLPAHWDAWEFVQAARSTSEES